MIHVIVSAVVQMLRGNNIEGIVTFWILIYNRSDTHAVIYWAIYLIFPEELTYTRECFVFLILNFSVDRIEAECGDYLKWNDDRKTVGQFDETIRASLETVTCFMQMWGKYDKWDVKMRGKEKANKDGRKV